MALLWALLGVLASQEGADLRKEVERLRAENSALRERADLLEQESLESARRLQRLERALKLLESGAAATPAATPAAPAAKADGEAAPAKPEFPGPAFAIKGKVVHVDPVMNFVALSVGKRQGVQAKYRFEIFRETFDNGADTPVQTRLGVGEVDKFMGEEESLTKLKILEGDIKDMKLDDVAVAIRVLQPVVAAAEKPAAPRDPSQPGIFKITGRAGAGYLTDYGQLQGARQTDIVFCYKDGTLKARLRVDRVDKNYSVMNVIGAGAGPGIPPPEVGDEIYTRELDKVLSGKISFSNAQKNLLAIDLRARDGVKVGQTFEVHRLGKKIGLLKVTDVQQWGSWAAPEGDTQFGDLTKGDIVRVVDEK